ncbi:hypothetical protein JW979_16150, partial [bacterium]|nr:hypothetical protein [candidate division CSSED10-310 bacterium]
ELDEALWQCRYLEPLYKQLSSEIDQINYLMIYANLCERIADYSETIRLCDLVINTYTTKDKILEARLLKADALNKLGMILDAQKELWLVRDQTSPETLAHKTAVEKLNRLE